MVTAVDLLDREQYLLPVIKVPLKTCAVCYGAVTDYDTCYKCGIEYSSRWFPDRLGFGIFAQAGEQSGSVMSRYKNSPDFKNQAIIQALAMLAIRESSQKFHVDLITTIPSLQGRSGKHPLLNRVERAQALIPGSPPVESVLLPKLDVESSRDFNPDNFQVSENLSGKSVFLIDDTWVSGGHLLSATGALRRSGAATVNAAVLARWLAAGNRKGENDIRKIAESCRRSFTEHQFFP